LSTPLVVDLLALTIKPLSAITVSSKKTNNMAASLHRVFLSASLT
jgi:hypothetical protein